MTPKHSHHAGANTRTRAFTLVEVTVAVVIVGVLAVAALNTVGSAAGARLQQSQRTRALILAEDLLAEVLAKPYEDPQNPDGAIGLDSGEGNNSRAAFDDVDDYQNWIGSPPTRNDGAAIAWANAFQRKVKVAWVTATNPAQVSASETGVKRIQVTVYLGQKQAVQLIALRSRTGAGQ